MALFLHQCDARRAEQDLRHYSGVHYLIDELVEDVGTGKNSSLLQGQPQQQVCIHIILISMESGVIVTIVLAQQTQHHYHHKVPGNVKNQRHIDFAGASQGEPWVLISMRSTEPSHFNIYLLNHHHNRRRDFVNHLAESTSSSSHTDKLTSSNLHHQDESQTSPVNEKNKGNFDFLGTGFQSLPKSVDADQKQQHKQHVLSMFPYGGSNHSNAGSRKHTVEELFVPEGRQNVFLTILFYLITSQALAAESTVNGGDDGRKISKSNGSGGGQLEGALRDLAVEVFGSARVPGNLRLP